MNPELLHLLLPLLLAYPDLLDHLSPYLNGETLGYLAAMINLISDLATIALIAVMAVGIIRLHRRVTELENGGLNIDVGMMNIPHDSDAGQEFFEHLSRSIRDDEEGQP